MRRTRPHLLLPRHLDPPHHYTLRHPTHSLSLRRWYLFPNFHGLLDAMTAFLPPDEGGGRARSASATLSKRRNMSVHQLFGSNDSFVFPIREIARQVASLLIKLAQRLAQDNVEICLDPANQIIKEYGTFNEAGLAQ